MSSSATWRTTLGRIPSAAVPVTRRPMPRTTDDAAELLRVYVQRPARDGVLKQTTGRGPGLGRVSPSRRMAG